jgi:DNA-binding Lrp family transcriptional regulator
MLDNIDELILSTLSKNSRQDNREIWDFLRGYGHNLAEEEIQSRIARLEEEGVITGYTISVNTTKIRRRVIRVVLVTFRTSQHLPKRLEGLKHLLSCFLAEQGVDMIGYACKLFHHKKWRMRKVIFTETYSETSYNLMKYMILYQ